MIILKIKFITECLYELKIKPMEEYMNILERIILSHTTKSPHIKLLKLFTRRKYTAEDTKFFYQNRALSRYNC